MANDSNSKISLELLLALYPISFLISLAILEVINYLSPWIAFFCFPDACCLSAPFTFIIYFGLSSICRNYIGREKKYWPLLVILLLIIAGSLNAWIYAKITTFFALAGFFD